MAHYRWDEENPLLLYIEDQEIDLDTKGVEYARQFGHLTSWLGRNALPALMGAVESGSLEQSDDYGVAINLLTGFMDLGFSSEAIVELAGILINKDQAFVEEYFDPGWFVEALLRSYDYRPGVKSAFVSLYQRFFLATRTDSGDAEGEASD